MSADSLTLLVKVIVSEQKTLIGPLAIEEANKVSGIKVSADLRTIQVQGNSDRVLTDLVQQYAKLFGQASVEACRESVRNVMSQVSVGDIPAILR